MKRLQTLKIACLLLLLVLPAVVRAQTYTNSYGVWGYATNADGITLNITGYTGPGGSLTIPTNIDGLTVTAIGMDAFSNCTTMTNVTIGTNVTSIGYAAFGQCTRLTGVIIPDSVTNIGDWAFNYCTSLTNATIGSGVISIGDDAFSFCGRLTSVTTGDSVASIGESAFAACTSLTNVTIGTNVTSIGAGAFDSCGVLTAITVATNNPAYSSVAGVLFNQSQTTLIQYPGGKAGSYTVPNSVTSIGDGAFDNCSDLISATIGDSVTSIGAGAFYQCINLTNVSIGAGLTSIGYDGFDGCYSLTAITVATNNPAFSSVAGVLFNQSQTALLRCPGGIVGSCTIPSSVTSIGNFAFLNDYKLNAVYFEGNAPSLGSSVFDDALTVYYLPGTTGWSSSLEGMPTVLWNPQALTSDPGFGVRTNQFGFNITGSSNLVIVVEACTNLSNPVWQPIQTNTLTGGMSYFSDPQWMNYPGRFYRFRSP